MILLILKDNGGQRVKLNTIKNHLNGYFINQTTDTYSQQVKETLCKKIDGNDYEVLDNVNTPNGLVSPMVLLLQQCNNQILDPTFSICSLSEILPVINGSIFESYAKRQKEIIKHRKWQKCCRTESNRYAEDTYLIKWKRPKGISYGIVGEGNIVEINELILTDNQKKNAVKISYPNILVKAIRDVLINEFEEEYLKEVEKYNSL